MDPRTFVERENCRVCNKSIPKDYKKSNRWTGKEWCSTNCFNKENWKSERTQLILYCIFGLFALYITGSFMSQRTFSFTLLIIIGLVIYQLNEMKKYPWKD